MRKKNPPKEINTTVSGAVSQAFSVIEELGYEMREAYENTPESLQSSAVGEARGEAADNLENISEPDIPESIAEVPVKFFAMPLKAKASRADRLDEGLDYARNAVDALQEIMDEHLLEDEEDAKFGELTREDVEAVIEEINDMIEEAENVSFPGMFG